ncbi:programmed cell death protein 2-like [Tachyglossus aculeatus]|uniref:programmed cell death protein 2-like n=1 Tax=Tachyglossus aculeatus TaxID=9261 RepID=UPI0018F7C049|nr:programmed cell death protein 2-like [Tachyglossus aculeatus]
MAGMAGPPVLLGLRDAAVAVGACTTSKLGGSPDCAPSINMVYPLCGICRAALAHIVQIYCPLEGSPFHRIINVFACVQKECWGKPESWQVLRSQCSQLQGKGTQHRKSKQQQMNNFATKDWCEEADDWGAEEMDSQVQVTKHLESSEKATSSVALSKDCTARFQELSLEETTDGLGSCGGDIPPWEGLLIPSSVPVFQPYYISVVDEADYTGFIDTDHAQRLLREYQLREGIDAEQLVSESIFESGEKYEKTEAKNRDKVFHKFMKRISVCHEQILRYSRSGQPLFITCPSFDTKEIPPCRNCGSDRTFEFQLMPALVSMLNSFNGGLSVEFGTVLVYTCERSCWPSNQQTPLEEFCVVQEDPDQLLFK